MDKDCISRMNETILFGQFDAFTKRNEIVENATIQMPNSMVPEAFQEYEYPVSSWPVIIDTAMATELKKLSTSIPKLIHQIPEKYFKNDKDAISKFYFDNNKMMAEIALMTHAKNIEQACRLDLVLTDEGFKLLELNIGSSIGGWQIQSFERPIRSLHKMLSDTPENQKFVSENTQNIYMQFLLDKIKKTVEDVQLEINLFVYVGDAESREINQSKIQFLKSLLKENLEGSGMKGTVCSGDMSDVRIVNKKIIFEDKRIHGFLLMAPETIPSIVYRAAITNEIYLPDHLGMAINSDKRNLALLRELAEDGIFTSEENNRILEVVPWTVIVKQGNVRFENDKFDLLQLLKNNRDKFVLKPARGLGGRDVYVGRFLSQETWQQVVEKSQMEELYIAQEYCKPNPIAAPTKSNDWKAHQLIWGVFGFGNNYGGTWVRMSESENTNGVINSATGAVEALVFESLV